METIKTPYLSKGGYIKYTVIASTIVVLIYNSFYIVPTGTRGVKTTFGEVMDPPLPEGIHFKVPFAQEINDMNVRTQIFQGETDCYTRDIQTAKLKYTVYFNLSPETSGKVFKGVGIDWKDTFIPQSTQGQIKAVIGQWDAVDLISNREKATADILNSLKELLEKRYINVTQLEITNIDYNTEFEKSVEDKVIAAQDAAKAQNQTKRIEEESRQRIISAKAEAESMKIRSDALQQNKNFILYEAIKRWDGKLPTYIAGNGIIPFINLGEQK